ncbi:alpha/beta hydrolase [Pseudoalteromonas sp. G4]|uniref:alpha/beta hydrolase n=1 Tax=Pseudoalteromonas sp. G4 TaxID=2992761 RepID=UPI00237D96F9|nr:alpha/beta hydrolase [Pseudoalteromonas sp. G4]MDE3272026.1 alpha/beta hydrolase [Pseudoalteromonas sp. G4]
MSVWLFSLLLTNTSMANQVLNNIPENYNKASKFVFYSHGFIVEGDNPMPIETKHGWGVYDFPSIKQALSDARYTLVATHRKKNTDPFIYAKQLSENIRSLVKNGVKPTHITLVGFSRGAFITGLTSHYLQDIGVNIILLAGCGRLISSKHSDIQVYGDVLSVYEKSDAAKSCAKLKAKSTALTSFEEIEINTGLSHGAFYTPSDEWLVPVKNWIAVKMNLG